MNTPLLRAGAIWVIAGLGCAGRVASGVQPSSPPGTTVGETALPSGSDAPGQVGRESIEHRADSGDAQSPREMDSKAPSKGKSERELLERVFLGGSSMPTDVIELTAYYRLISVGRLYKVHDVQSNRVVVVATYGGNEAPVCLTGNTAAAADFVTRQFKGRGAPGDLRQLWELLTVISVGPSAIVATAEVLRAEERDGVEGWLKGRQTDPRAFESLCTGVRATRSKNQWEMQSNVFRPDGGVESLKAAGTVSPFTVQNIAVEEIHQAGEFSFEATD